MKLERYKVMSHRQAINRAQPSRVVRRRAGAVQGGPKFSRQSSRETQPRWFWLQSTQPTRIPNLNLLEEFRLSSPSPLFRWAQLVRLPNTFTVIADVSAAFLLLAHGGQPVGRLIVVVLAGICLYWAGMILNDLFDIEKDRLERPQRPLPAGHISLNAARRAGWGLLLFGVVLAAASGYVPAEGWETTWRPAAVGLVLAVLIVAYDGPLKRSVAAPLVMGLCRFSSFLLGASVLLTGPVTDLASFAPQYVLAFATGMGVYVMGVTNMARHEADISTRSPTLPIGLVVAMVGGVILAIAPGMAPADVPWQVSPERGFPMLIGLIALAVFVRGVRVIFEPSAAGLQMLIRVSVLTIIPLSAAIALLAAGPVWAIGIFAMVVPAILLSARFRVT